MMALMAVVCGTFTACGGDDDDSGSSPVTYDKHRIDIQFSEGTEKNLVVTTLYALKKDGSYADLYEKGQKIVSDPMTHSYTTMEVRDISIESEDGCATAVAGVSITGSNGRALTSDVTVTLVGYIDGKRLYTRVYTVPAGKRGMVVSFSTAGENTCDAIISE